MDLDWKPRLRAALHEHERVAVVGVGRELRGDDAAGLLVLERLRERLAGFPPDRAPLLLPVGPLPEGAAGPLRRFQPDLVLFIDAALMELTPGAIAWIDPPEAGGFSASTHTFPLSEISRYLQAELGCRIAILGVQPQGMDFDAPVSAAAEAAVDLLVREMAACWAGDTPDSRNEDNSRPLSR